MREVTNATRGLWADPNPIPGVAGEAAAGAVERLDTPLETAYLGPANENVLVVDRLASIATQN